MQMAIKLLLISALAGGAAFAQGSQNADLGILFNYKTSGNGYSIRGAICPAYEVLSTKAGDLYVEMPIEGAFVTPGLRLRIPLHWRFSLYGAVDGGVGLFTTYNAVVLNTIGPDNATGESAYVVKHEAVRGAFAVGAGIDFRLTKILSLRVEERDFITGRDLGDQSGRSHAFFASGIAFHF
jgi:hypothetical protein